MGDGPLLIYGAVGFCTQGAYVPLQDILRGQSSSSNTALFIRYLGGVR